MSQQQEIRQCTWKCPVCKRQCTGIEGHEQHDMNHQCPVHYNPFNHTDTYCPATISHKHQWNNTVKTNTTNKGDRWLSIHCKACQHVKRLEDT